MEGIAVTDYEEQRERARGWSPPDTYVHREPPRFRLPDGPDTFVLPVGVPTQIPGTDVYVISQEEFPVRLGYSAGGPGRWAGEVL